MSLYPAGDLKSRMILIFNELCEALPYFITFVFIGLPFMLALTILPFVFLLKYLGFDDNISISIAVYLFVVGFIIWKLSLKDGDGVHVSRFENGNIASTGRIRFGRKRGVWREWYENGQLSSKGRYKGGHKWGLWLGWHENGERKSERVYHGLTSIAWIALGEVASEWCADGVKKLECSYYGKGRSGMCREWYKNGQLKSEGAYLSNGELFRVKDMREWKHGEWKEWYENGNQRLLAEYDLNGRKEEGRDGKWIEWREDGLKLLDTSYSMGKHDGEHCEWYGSGELKCRGRYYSGIRRGEWTEWYENGIMKSEGDLKWGDWKKWHENGKVQYEVKSEGQDRDRRRMWSEFYESGIKKSEGLRICDKSGGEWSIDKDKMEGLWIFWYPNGAKRMERFYVAGNLIDIKNADWYEDGSVSRQFVAEGDDDFGHIVEWHENGQKALSLPVLYGQRHGELCEWDDTGRVVRRVYFDQDLLHGTEEMWDFAESGVRGNAYNLRSLEWVRGESSGIEKVVEFRETVEVLDGEVGPAYADYRSYKASESYYMDYQLHGPYREFYESGDPKIECLYKYGLKEGVEVFWYKKSRSAVDQQKQSSRHYVAGKLDGPYKEWISGKLAREVQYVEGRKNGCELLWSKTGRKTGETMFEDGLRHGRETYWDVFGNQTSVSEYKKGVLDGERRLTDPNSKVSIIYHYVGGKLNGLCRRVYPNGDKDAEVNYSAGNPHGKYKKYYPNGVVEWEGEFNMGVKHGLHVWRYDDGGLELEVPYNDGVISGVARKWYNTGELACEYQCEDDKSVFTEWYESGSQIRSVSGVLAADFASSKFRVKRDVNFTLKQVF